MLLEILECDLRTGTLMGRIFSPPDTSHSTYIIIVSVITIKNEIKVIPDPIDDI